MRITVKAKPSAREVYVKKVEDAIYEVAVKEPPSGGRANAAIREAVAEHFKIPYLKVKIVSGWTSRQKVLEIS